MRYIGSKTNILDFLEESILKAVKKTNSFVFTDLFAGTAVVAKNFKKLGFKIISNDYLAFSYMFQLAYIKNNEVPKFKKLKIGNYIKVLEYLNNLSSTKGFFYNNYCVHKDVKIKRNYFSVENSKKVDSILKKLKQWQIDKRTSKAEDAILRTSLIEAVTKVSNTSGTYGAFLKHDDPRKYKKIYLEPIDIIVSNLEHKCFNKDTNSIITNVEGDIRHIIIY